MPEPKTDREKLRRIIKARNALRTQVNELTSLGMYSLAEELLTVLQGVQKYKQGFELSMKK